MAGSSQKSWNDPPILKFEATSARTKSALNQRVFSPLNTETKNDTVCKGSSNNITELEKSLVVPKCPISSSNDLENSTEKKYTDSTPDSEVTCSDEHMSAFVFTTLKDLLDVLCVKTERTYKDIERRIILMEESWQSTLSIEVKKKMYDLCQELKTGNSDAAMKIQCSLMVDNVREVKSWMVGVKRIIELKKEKE